MALETLIASVITMRPFLPARNFPESQSFYETLGFDVIPLGDALAHVQLGPTKGAFSFLLQDFYVKEFAENLMMHLLVADLDGWWAHIASLGLHDRFTVKAPAAPCLQSWGLRVAYIWDPAGVLWHIAADD